ncbi:hypothetical protein [Tengunoibacter tsumagoiensis]|uniref:Adhesin domain-containing protein n=1 Tax=Tengunoibacter tsumagoiensis TaxID=2014871 RepID=A0A401ZU41_9CHLR|nr:hypothetical protein [Tengunoibacter tsumagoiensis]GCE10415.1 hypothetical protein KTT_02740 [Tengunoibacter tsumagoiensis]
MGNKRDDEEYLPERRAPRRRSERDRELERPVQRGYQGPPRSQRQVPPPRRRSRSENVDRQGSYSDLPERQDRSHNYSKTQRPRSSGRYDEDYDQYYVNDEVTYDDDFDEFQTNRRMQPRSSPSSYVLEDEEVPRKRRKKRSSWPTLLSGCALGILFVILAIGIVVVVVLRGAQGQGLPPVPGFGNSGVSKAFTKEENVNIPLTALSQIILCNKTGNVTLKVDNQVTQPTITTKKTVHATSQSEADQKFSQLAVQVQPPTSALSCTTNATGSTSDVTPTATPVATTASSATALIVNTIFPTGSSTVNSVDISISLPQSILPADNPSMQINVESSGNIVLDGLSGTMNIKGGIGTVSVQHSVLADGSRISAHGKVSFSGFLNIPPTTAPNFILQSEYGITVTLPSNANVVLDANTNVGTVKSDFNTPIPAGNGPVNYRGPLNPDSAFQSQATLVLDVSTGDVIINKAA